MGVTPPGNPSPTTIQEALSNDTAQPQTSVDGGATVTNQIIDPTSGEKVTKSMFNKEKWLKLCYLPFRISHLCCNEMKKKPMHKYARESKQVPILGTMANESRIRRQGWIKTGCNAFDGSHSKSMPMSFWTEQDVLNYIQLFGLEIASVYGDIVDERGYSVDITGQPVTGKLHTTGADRTGCIFCAFGMQQEQEKKGESRYQRIKRTHPKQYDFAVGGGQWIDNPDYIENCPEYDGIWRNYNPERIWVPSKEGLGFGKVFDMINEEYGTDLFRYK